jgi:hypothetical protein
MVGGFGVNTELAEGWASSVDADDTSETESGGFSSIVWKGTVMFFITPFTFT